MPHLARSDAARVVIVNAVIARRPETAMIAVGSARAALLNMTRALATELASAKSWSTQ
jgi:NAD(P)-dependent dehydrogenase (short-subunit alcohol dehydrogenase family)